MNKQTIINRVDRILREQLFVSEISSSSKIVDDLGADSLDIAEIVLALEEEFEIEILDEDCFKPEPATVQGACDYIEKRLGK